LATTFIELRRTSPANARHDCRPFAVDAERKSIQDGRIVLSVPLVWRPTALWLLREQVERLHIRLTLRLGVPKHSDGRPLLGMPGERRTNRLG
jgi:hypothetical protein